MDRKAVAAAALAVLVVVVAGCTSPENAGPDETLGKTPTTEEGVSVAPHSLQLSAGEFESFEYWDKTINVSYRKENSINKVVVQMAGESKTISKEKSDSPEVVNWAWGNFSFGVKPLTWKNRDGQMVPFCEETWNTSNISFEVRYTGPQPSGEGGAMR